MTVQFPRYQVMHNDEFYNSLDIQYTTFIPVKNSKPLMYCEKQPGWGNKLAAAALLGRQALRSCH